MTLYINKKLRHPEDDMLTATVAIIDQWSRFILMSDSMRGNRGSKHSRMRQLNADQWGEMKRERGVRMSRRRLRRAGRRQRQRRERERETERMRAISGRFWLTLSPLAEQLDFISGWC